MTWRAVLRRMRMRVLRAIEELAASNTLGPRSHSRWDTPQSLRSTPRSES